MALLGRVLARILWRLLRSSPAGGGRAGGVLVVWLAWDRLYRAWVRARPIREGGLLEVARGTRDGEPVLVVHFDNPAFARRRREPYEILREGAADLRALARRDDLLRGVRAIVGVSLWAPAARRLGFEVRPLPDTFGTRLLRYFLVGFAAIYHPDGWRGIRRPESLWPAEARLDVESLRRMVDTH